MAHDSGQAETGLGAVFPAHWTAQRDPVDCVRLPRDSEEFAMAAARCIESVDSDVHDVYRVQNPALYERFALRRAQLARDYAHSVGDGEHAQEHGRELERLVWHGTDTATAEKIVRRGFNRSFSRRAAFGKGVYFAHSAAYSASPTYAKRDAHGRGVLLLTRMLCSAVVRGSPGMVEAPAPGVCAVDSRSAPNIYVTFEDDCAYCSHVIIFTDRADRRRTGHTARACHASPCSWQPPPPPPQVPVHKPTWTIARVPSNLPVWRPPVLQAPANAHS